MSEAAVECVVVGAGVVGLAVARALAKAGIEVMVLEREYGIGFETSSRNSEVIHAGIYYPKDSLKALTCVEGKRRLYAYCAAHGVPHKRLGKLIVACSEEELPLLDGIRARAAANGVEDLVALDARELRRLEPALAALGGLLSPSTGIIDSHALMLAYQGEAEAAGAMVVFRAPSKAVRCERTASCSRSAAPNPCALPAACSSTAPASTRRPWRAASPASRRRASRATISAAASTSR